MGASAQGESPLWQSVNKGAENAYSYVPQSEEMGLVISGAGKMW